MTDGEKDDEATEEGAQTRHLVKGTPRSASSRLADLVTFSQTEHRVAQHCDILPTEIGVAVSAQKKKDAKYTKFRMQSGR